MNRLKSFSRKVLLRTAFFMLLFTAAFDAAVFFGFGAISTTGMIDKDMFVRQFIPVSAALWVVFTLMVWLAVRSLAGNQLSGDDTGTKKTKTSEEEARLIENQHKRFFLHLLSILQRDARLLDFFSEKLDQFEDAQIGAAVRNIHENSFKTITKYLSPEPVIASSEGEEVVIDKGFDPAMVKLTGNVTGEPPFKGILRHKGWQAGALELPVLSERDNTLLISPAEVEIR